LHETPHVTHIQGDVTSPATVEDLVRDHDAVFHLAAVVGFANVMRDPLRTLYTSINGTHTVLHACYKHKKRMLLTSTSAVYGRAAETPEGVYEDDDGMLGPTARPSWSYAYAKAVDECFAFAYHRQYRVPVIITRVFNTVGPRQSADAGFVLPRFAQSAVKGTPLEVHSPGTQSRTFCHVMDVARGLAQLMECDAAVGEQVDIGGTHTISMWDLAVLVRRIANSQSAIQLVPQPYGPGYDNVQDRKPALAKARRLFGYRPLIPLEKIVQDVVSEARAWHEVSPC
jgi:UDP-glucose 4-epimerase